MKTLDNHIDSEEKTITENEIWEQFEMYCMDWQNCCEAYKNPFKAAEIMLSPKRFFAKYKEFFTLVQK